MTSNQRAVNFWLGILAVLLALLAVAGCDDAENSKVRVSERGVWDSGHDAHGKGAPLDTGATQALPAGLTMCSIARDVDVSIDTLQRWAHALVRDDDSCTLAVLDSLVARFIDTADVRYLTTLDSLHAYSDGAVAEHFRTLTTTMLAERPVELLSYLKDSAADPAPMAWHLISSWQSEFEGHSDSNAVKRRIRQRVRASIASAPLTPQTSDYLDDLLRRARLTE